MSAETNSTSIPALISIVNHPNIPAITYINSDKFIVGRGYEATLKILEKAISRKHCTLEKDSSNEWIITSHSRNAVEINTTSLFMDQSKPLKCGDKINVAGVCSFIFKCNPDLNKNCCDKTQGDIVIVDLADEEDEEDRSSIPVVSLNDDSSELLTNVVSTTTQRVIDETSSPISSKEIDDSTLMPELSNALEQIKKYTSKANEFDDSVKESVDVLRDRTKFLDQLLELSNKLSENMVAEYEKTSSPIIKKLISLFKEDKRKSESIKLVESRDKRLRDIYGKVNMLVNEQKEHFFLVLCSLYEHSFPSAGSGSRNSEEDEEPVVQSVSKTDITDEPAGDDKLKDELKIYKQNSEWQEARIQYLEMKLKERDKLEKQLESAKEETENLQTQIGDMRTKLSKVEVLELEVNYLKERSKYQEDDKRNKDELENRIETLRMSLQKSKEEVETVTMAKSVLESKMTSLKQKCEEIEKKLNTKVGCSTNQATGEYCCDLFTSLKDNVLEALEKEFTCCICNEMFVGATVTNCNHVFCAYCLKEWKKKKKQCPFCRAALTNEHRAKVIDECITNLLKCVSDKILAERMQMIEDRKSTGSPPPAKRVRRRGAVGIVQHPQVSIPMRNHPYAGPASINMPYAHQNFVIDLINLG